MGKYPTNKTKILRKLSSYPVGTCFKTANGMICELDNQGSSTLGHLKVISYVPGVDRPSGKGGGYWNQDGSKVYAHDWPVDSHIVEAL